MGTDESPLEPGWLRPHVFIATAIDLGVAIVVFAVRKRLDDHAVWRLLSSRGGRSPPAVPVSELQWIALE
jgi:hypothetical protein